MDPNAWRGRFFADVFTEAARRLPGLRVPSIGERSYVRFRHRGITHFAVAFTRDDKVVVELCVQGQYEETKALFDALAADRAAIEAEFGQPLLWERSPTMRRSEISAHRRARALGDPHDVADARAWAADAIVRLVHALEPRVAAVEAT